MAVPAAPTRQAIPGTASGSATATPSQAYMLGQAHGKTLAIQHHANGGAVPGGDPYSLAGLTQQAQSAAVGDTNFGISAWKQQQNDLLAQASERARQINLASQAAAHMQTGIGDQTLASYQSGANDLAALAKGYVGSLGDTATQAAQGVSQGLAAIGAPNRTVPASGQTEGLQNLLYGLGGALPASVLETTGLAQAGAQRQLPAATLGYGQQQAIGALGQGNQDAQALTSQISALIAKEPSLAQTYLGRYVSQAQAAQTAQYLQDYRAAQIAQGNARVAQAGTKIANDAAYKTNEITLGQHRIDASISETNARIATQTSIANARIAASERIANARTAAQAAAAAVKNAPHYNATVSKSLGFRADQYGNPVGGKITLLPGFTAGPDGNPVKVSSGSTSLSASGLSSALKTVTASIKKGATGSQSHEIYQPTAPAAQQVTGPDGQPTGFIKVPGSGTAPVPYQQALAQAVAANPPTVDPVVWARRVKVIVDASYPPGANGRFYQGASARNKAVPLAKDALAAAIAHGAVRGADNTALVNTAVAYLVSEWIPPGAARDAVTSLFDRSGYLHSGPSGPPAPAATPAASQTYVSPFTSTAPLLTPPKPLLTGLR